MDHNIQEQSIEILEDFFLNSADEDLYALLQEVLKRPLMEKNEWNTKRGKWLVGNHELFLPEAEG
ncbi:MAG: hypothetical protein SVY10_11015 [Thermodesulfobacteriota bacterium]|nr:hypothetical protein [Thermodesulfobacteriota bacterium]